jgi:TRAP-type C4-dicarboxylate transport system permease small subunit
VSVGRVFRVLRKVEELVLAWGIILMAALTVLNVFSRSLFGNSLAFAEELSQFLIILVTFVGLSFGASRGRHIRMTAIYDQLNARWRKGLMVMIAGTTSVLMFVLAWYAVDYVLTVQELGTVSPALQVPLYLIYLAAPLGFVLAGIQYALTALKNLRAPEVYLSYDKKDEYEPLDTGTGAI